MALSKKQLEDVCMLGKGYMQCRYLEDEAEYNGKTVCVCKKLTSDASIIDEEVDEFIIDAKKSGSDIKVLNNPIQINCSGYVMLKAIKQGYDVK